MIHSARHTVPPVVMTILVWTLFCEILKSGNGRAEIVNTTDRDFGSASWINFEFVSLEKKEKKYFFVVTGANLSSCCENREEAFQAKHSSAQIITRHFFKKWWWCFSYGGYDDHLRREAEQVLLARQQHYFTIFLPSTHYLVNHNYFYKPWSAYLDGNSCNLAITPIRSPSAKCKKVLSLWSVPIIPHHPTETLMNLHYYLPHPEHYSNIIHTLKFY